VIIACPDPLIREGAFEEKGIHLSAADHEDLEEAGIYQGVLYITFLNP